MPDFTCDLAQTPEAFAHHWEHTVGSGHAPLALRADWQAQLAQSRQDLGFQHVRFHGILSYPMDTLIEHQDAFLYSFLNIDRIVDFLLSIGMRPFMELSFMPMALASGDETVFHYASNVTPPKDYRQWGTLIRRLVTHLVERYGLEEVRRWYLEVWNEPNLEAFWSGTQKEYFRLYRHAATAIKEVDASLRVGGPATAQNAWIPAFLAFCDENDVPVDFVTTHHYPTDAFGEPGDSTIETLAQAERSTLQKQTQKAAKEAQGLPLYYTEWNSSSNPRDDLHDRPYAAAFVAKTVMEAIGLVDGYAFWTFSDIFEENYFPSVPFHGGFGLMNLYGIPKPLYRAYQLLHGLGETMYAVHGVHETVDAWVTERDSTVRALLTNHALPRHPIQTELAQVHLLHRALPRSAYVERIDEEHANPRQVWAEMGEPEYLDRWQIAELMAASRLRKEHVSWHQSEGATHFDIDLPPQSVTRLTIEWDPSESSQGRSE